MLRLTMMIGWKLVTNLTGLDTLAMVIEIVIEVVQFVREHRAKNVAQPPAVSATHPRGLVER